MNAPLFKALARPVLHWGVPVGFLMWNYSLTILLGLAVGHFVKFPLIVGGGLHVCTYFLVAENPTIFFQLANFFKCRFRNIRRGLFGGAFYSPINYKLSANYINRWRDYVRE